MVEIKGLEKFASKDYPGFLSATVFVAGCNFRCPYCNNRDLVLRPETLPTLSREEFISFLDVRRHWLEAVCFSGGEPLLHRDLEELLGLVKEREFRVKVDTNGAFPARLQDLMREGLVDCIAMDVKAPLARYQEVVGTEVRADDIERSIELIRNSHLEYVFRTTVVPGLIGTEDIDRIGRMLKGSRLFQIQQFSPRNTLDQSFLQKEPYGKDVIQEMARVARPYFDEVRIEGV